VERQSIGGDVEEQFCVSVRFSGNEFDDSFDGSWFREFERENVTQSIGSNDMRVHGAVDFQRLCQESGKLDEVESSSTDPKDSFV
jgi:hypothetical protein